MPEAVKEVKEPKKIEPLIDEVQKVKGTCPWCSYENQDEEKGEVHTKVKTEYFVRNTGHKWQCDSCGKNWDKKDLGKTWTLELERGPLWARQNKIRQLGGTM